MFEIESLKDHDLVWGEPNFLVGIAGNGLTTALQKEFIYSKDKSKKYQYLNFLELESTKEIDILTKIVTNILFQVGEFDSKEIVDKDFSSFEEIFEFFYNKVEGCGFLETLLIIDGFEYMLSLSDSFFYHLGKILGIKKAHSNIEITSVLVSDMIIDPDKMSDKRSLRDFIFGNMNFHTIKMLSCEKLNKETFSKFENLSEIQKREIYSLSGGNPSLAWSICKMILSGVTNRRDILLSSELTWKILSIRRSIGEEGWYVLRKIYKDPSYKPVFGIHLRLLAQANIVDLRTKEILIGALKDIINFNEEQTLREKMYKINNIEIESKKLTRQTEKLLAKFLKSKGETLSRVDIAEIIWGADYHKKYSDWAIDKSISELRKIFKTNGLQPSVLKTIRGRGYVLDF